MESNNDRQTGDPMFELRNAEQKYYSFIEKRNELNDQARAAREGRDLLNKGRKDLSETIKELRSKRDAAVKVMREHKAKRNEYQKQAKALIASKNKKREGVETSIPMRINELRAEIQMLEYRQETVPMSSAKENVLIDEIRLKRAEYEHLNKEMKKQHELKVNLSDDDKSIDGLFKSADREHEQVQLFYTQSQEEHEKYVELMKEITVLIDEANKKHEDYISLKKRADEAHTMAQELRTKVMSMKRDRYDEHRARKQAINDVNIAARKTLHNEGALNQVADSALDALKKGKKISL